MKIIIYYNLIVDHHDLKTRDSKKMAKEIYLEEKDTLTIWRPDDMWPWQNDWMILWRIEGNFAVSLLTVWYIWYVSKCCLCYAWVCVWICGKNWSLRPTKILHGLKIRFSNKLKCIKLWEMTIFKQKYDCFD